LAIEIVEIVNARRSCYTWSLVPTRPHPGFMVHRRPSVVCPSPPRPSSVRVINREISAKFQSVLCPNNNNNNKCLYRISVKSRFILVLNFYTYFILFGADKMYVCLKSVLSLIQGPQSGLFSIVVRRSHVVRPTTVCHCRYELDPSAQPHSGAPHRRTHPTTVAHSRYCATGRRFSPQRPNTNTSLQRFPPLL
jgi:hypothetical protein